ncbi:MAG: glycerol-3-phosphate 1-O-acyltransferase PlsY, partial [Planctomycetaceae bacterium]|nr:glycerol-3-phosphate 1-O-acyltransferase PlsY [Planctomycetaceae bacterium]
MLPPPAQFGLVAIAGFLVGSIPFSLLIARWVAGIDLRKVGSGNVGATNVWRAVGPKWGILALLCDALKGLLPVLLLPRLLAVDTPNLLTHLGVLAGVAALLGHLFPPWLGFRGGKGVATALGVVTVLAPWATLWAFVAFLILFFATRIVSVCSLGAALTFAIYKLTSEGSSLWSADRWSIGLFSIAVPLLIIVMHRTNIRRL